MSKRRGWRLSSDPSQGSLKVDLLSSQGSGSAALPDDSAGAEVRPGRTEAVRAGRWGGH